MAATAFTLEEIVQMLWKINFQRIAVEQFEMDAALVVAVK